jgi:hypothetical protein
MFTIIYLLSSYINYVRATPIYAIIKMINPRIIEFFLPMGCNNVPAIGEKRKPPISKAMIIYET